ncbi:hypothetical protein E2C01_027909 [Portunus trituberculatus]|uniref:Uncharacterized protein n=1 Tax=Portunus trituberculatus TaxID=210409 RepID=A0A5B7EML8_PORTR|nr:hypothetical protein [Portunus trituberculatus]
MHEGHGSQRAIQSEACQVTCTPGPWWVSAINRKQVVMLHIAPRTITTMPDTFTNPHTSKHND